MEILSPINYAKFEQFLIQENASSIFQSTDFADFKIKAKSREQSYFIVVEKDKNDRIVGGTLVFKMNLFKKYSFFYCPRGPLNIDPVQLADFLKPISKEQNAVFLRIDPPTLQTEGKLFPGFLKSHSPQPENTLVLDLTMPPEEILKQMHPKGRYNIKVAQKNGVEVFKCEKPEHIDKFHTLIEETTKRDGFFGHPKRYYETMLEELSPKNMATLYLASYKGEIIAGLLATFYKDTAIYYYGASSNAHRNVMAPYLLQWTAIQDSKNRGLKFYDFLGISPQNVKNHPWAGVTDFKLKFGGNRISYFPAQDFPFKKALYLLFRIYKKFKEHS
ncbi:MAG: peptidoglycan bridge formation glycyltransferase FemA/FemB family protein [Candidatus Gracilibacteria bacterium]|jgi:lipid II:glycine glycyltransferase (peptidoglycan interpeptide bridge formation enzyme)|nr:peptidoglycan bridge formation glycyltransferase FemA/FemB family protein [Candidatus Gracilibacteria bacterium]